ncbi:MAG: FkbM family methyltransferase [Nitrosomonadales bacterium]|nr:FkbM family methyltransferase [Nitrosomonadales bacterium]
MKLLDAYPPQLSVAIGETRYKTHAELAARHGVDVEFSSAHIEVHRSGRTLRIHKGHIIYLNALIRFFDFYWESVEPVNEFGKPVCDFSPERYHRVIGFDLMPVLFPSLAEPVSTIAQYLEFARLEKGHTVLDLGAYAGLSAMLFKLKVGEGGRVIALEPDPHNHRCMKINLDLFRRLTGLDIETVGSALWTDDAGVDFSADGCMGSSAVEYVGIRGDHLRVPSVTLDQLLARNKVGMVDLLKCDIEGAEDKVFRDSGLLRETVKRMVVEIHNPPAGLTSNALIPQLEAAGFECELGEQYGVDLPLLYASNTKL